VLSDAQKRAAYDVWPWGLASGRVRASIEAFTDQRHILGDFFGFGDIFGGEAAAGLAARNAAKIPVRLEIDFFDAVGA